MFCSLFLEFMILILSFQINDLIQEQLLISLFETGTGTMWTGYPFVSAA